MGLMEKFKNLFTDEEIVEEEVEEEPVKIKEIKKEETKEHKLPTFMREKIAKEEQEKKAKKNKEEPKKEEKIEKNEIKENVINEEVDFKPMDANLTEEKKNTFKFPIFDESDFVEQTRSSRHAALVEEEKKVVRTYDHQEIKEQPKEVKTETKVSKLYKDKKEQPEEIKRFKASPIISPIFGVLDKNYKPNEVATRSEDNYEINRRSKSIDFDSVRKKAYENKKDKANKTLEDDIEENLMCKNCEYLKKAKSCKKKNDEKENLMYNALCEKEEDITLDEAAENYFDYGVAYEKKQDIDPIYLEEDDEIKENVKIVNHENNENKQKKDIPPVKSSINLLSTIKKSMGEEEEKEVLPNKKEKDLELTDDLFNLIDSMYEERDD